MVGVLPVYHGHQKKARSESAMQSLIFAPKGDDRPTGILAVAALCALTGVASLVLAALLFLQVVPLSYGSLLLQGGLEQSGPVSFLIYGAAILGLAWGLWARRGWARRLTVLLAGVGVAFEVPAISSAVVDGRASSDCSRRPADHGAGCGDLLPEPGAGAGLVLRQSGARISTCLVVERDVHCFQSRVHARKP